jgi:drug/metabolite transporter (DMT)-like permease
MMLGAVLMSTIYSTVLKRHAKDQHPVATNAVFLSATAAVLGVAALFEKGRPIPWPPPFAPTIALLYLSLAGSVIAFATYFWLLKRVRLTTVATLSFVQPLVALAADALWEKQRLAPLTYAGAAITVSGVAVGVLVRRATLGSQSS